MKTDCACSGLGEEMACPSDERTPPGHDQQGYDGAIGRTPPSSPQSPVVIVWQPDSRVIGPFPDGERAVLWIEDLPNALVADVEELEHALTNHDFLLLRQEGPEGAVASYPGEVLAYPGEVLAFGQPWADNVREFIELARPEAGSAPKPSELFEGIARLYRGYDDPTRAEDSRGSFEDWVRAAADDVHGDPVAVLLVRLASQGRSVRDLLWDLDWFLKD